MNRASVLVARKTALAIAILATGLTFARSVRAADWPGFMGPAADGISPETAIFSTGPKRLELGWKRNLGSGYSAIAVAEGKAVTMYSDGKDDVVIALATSDGRELWRYPIDATYKGHDGSQDGPLSTPLIAAGKVFALAPRGKLVALDAATGKEVWKVDLVAEHGAAKSHWGFVTSPIIAGGALVVQGAAREALACGFDPQTGKKLWSAGQDTVNYQSPIPYAHGGRSCILAAGDAKLACIDPASGAALWQLAYEGAGERGATCMLPLLLDGNRVFLKHQDDRSKLVEVVAKDGEIALTAVWEDASIGKTYTPVVHHAGYLYGFNNRTLACVDAKTGKTAWRSRDPGDGFAIVVDGHLVLLTKEGGLHVARATSERYEEVGGLKVFEGLCWSPPSFSDGSIFARSMGDIARIDVRSADSRMAGSPSGTGPRSGPVETDPDLAGTRFAKFLDELRAAEGEPMLIESFLKEGSFPLVEPDGRVIFVYSGRAADVVVGGDLTGFGSKLRMNNVPGTNLFYAVARLEPEARIAYGFVCDYKAVTDPLNPRKTAVFGFDDDLELTFDFTPRELSWVAMPDWKPPKHIEPAEESRRGRIEPHKIKSEALGKEVEIEVYVPAGYDKGTEPLPVAYVHDGRTARGELHLVETLDNLIGRDIAPIIAVFIMHQPPFFGPQETYAKMAAEELPTFIDAKYRTVQTREGRAHVGANFAGVSAMYAALAHADKTAKLGVMSPFTVGTGAIDAGMKKSDKAPMAVYLDWCKYDLRSELEGWSMAKSGRELDQFFRDNGYKPMGGEAHDGSGISSWQNRTDDLLKALFPAQGGY